MTVYTYDFTGANGDGPPSPWVVNTISGTQNIQSNKWHIVNGASYGGTAMTWGTSTPVNVDFTATITTTATSAEQLPALCCRMSGGTRGWVASAETNGGYEFYINTLSDVATLAYNAAGVSTDIATTGFVTTGGTDYKMRFRVIADLLQGKVWAASGAEPDAWTVQTYHSSITAGGWVGFRDVAPANTTTSDWDDIVIDDDPAPPIRVQSLGTQVTNAAATTTVISFTGATKPQVGDTVVVYGSRDDAASEASTPTGDSFTDSHSNTYSKIVAGSGHTDATGANGQVGVMFYSFITTAWSGTETLTWTHPSTKAAMQMEHWEGLAVLRGSNTAVSTAGAPSCAMAGVVAGDIVLAMEAVEYSTAGTSTADTDTTGGSWTPISGPTATTGTTLAASKVISQWKRPGADGTQTYNPTHSVTASVDAIAIVADFAPNVPFVQSRYLPRGPAVQRAANR